MSHTNHPEQNPKRCAVFLDCRTADRIRVSSSSCGILHGIYRCRKGPAQESLVAGRTSRGLPAWSRLLIPDRLQDGRGLIPAELPDEIPGENFCRNYSRLVPGRPGFQCYCMEGGLSVLRLPRDLSHAMRRQKKDNRTYTWLCTTMHRPDRGYEEDKILRQNPTLKKGTSL